MPKRGLKVEFYDGRNQFRVPFIMYADFELILMPIQGAASNPNTQYTMKSNKHIPSGWCVYSKFAYGNVKDPLRLYRGEDCIEKFCKHVKNEAYRLYHEFFEKPMDPLSNKQWKPYKKSNKCHICYKAFNQKYPKVRDHCHYTRKYRGPAHRSCNLRSRIPSYILVVFHSLSAYDAHLFIKELGSKNDNISVITKNKEDYITFLIDVPVDK